ncbi:MAG: twin-arginine translocation signal domain-containing protein [Coriobacteriia bacterium]|nr:twin-arginine translocation signal domain-containing protein [Coriobacteriia bacterium]
MSTIRLNTAAITADALPYRPLKRGPHLSEVLDGLAGAPVIVSRRDVLKAAGVAAVVATGAVSIRSLEPMTVPEAGVEARGAWLRAGSHRTSLDPAAFGGSPKLNLSHNGDWRAVLADALFPGTAIPAGMQLHLVGQGILSRLRVFHDLGGFAAEVSLASWLAGEESATSRVDLSGESFDLGRGVALSFLSAAHATLLPDWSMRVEGPGVARITGLGADLVADAVKIGLAGEAASLLSRHVARRALITIEAAGRTWTLPSPEPAASGAVAFGPGTFDTLTVEAAETRAGAVYSAFVAQSSNGGTATFVPGMRGAVEDAAALALTGVRYARLLDGGAGYHVAARFSETPAWLPANGQALLVGAAEWSPPFEMTAREGVTRISAQPAVRGLMAPFEGALATPIAYPAQARATVNLGDPVRTGSSSASAILAPGVGLGPIIDLPIGIGPLPLLFGSTVSVTRPDDMLTLRFEFYNMAIVTDGGVTKLVRDNLRKTPYVAVYFPPQHILEQAIKDIPASIVAQLKTPLKAYLSQPSRLVFRVSDERIKNGIPYNLNGLLDWSGFTHYVVPAAKRVSSSDDLTAQMREPKVGSLIDETPPETSLELPWGLILSPYEEEWWSHRRIAFTSKGRTELWHTRLRGGFLPVGFGALTASDSVGASAIVGPGVTLPIAYDPGGLMDVIDPGAIGVISPGDLAPGFSFVEMRPTLRAVWGRLYQTRLNSPNSMALSAMPRQDLWRNSFTDGTLADPPGLVASDDIGGIGNRWSVIDLTGRYREAPIQVNHLMLTALGAWLDSLGVWDLQSIKADGKRVFGDVSKWEHRMTMGRDQFVKIEKIGRMFPWGHRAVQMTITERRVDAATGLAFLGQKSFIVIKEPVRTYSQEGTLLKRRMPFSKVEIKTKVTSQINSRVITGVGTGTAYWVKSVDTNSDYLFKCEATDWDGVVHKFETPMIFMFDTWSSNYGAAPTNTAANVVIDKCASSVRGVQVQMIGQKVAFAKATGSASDKRVMPTSWIRFDGTPSNPTTTVGDSRFEPLMFQASVRLDAIEELTGSDAGTTIRIADIYRDSGYGGGNSAGRVFAEIVTAPPVQFPAALSGALATPIPEFTGISATKGTFGGDLGLMGSGKFKPEDFFDAVNAKLLGGITLKDIIGVVLDQAVGATSGINEMPVFEKILDTAVTKTLTIRYSWSTNIKRSFTIFLAGSGCKLVLTAEVKKSLEDGAAPPEYLVKGELVDFKLHLVKGVFDAIILSFDKISFESVNGASPTVDPQISDVEFGGDLKYLAKLAEYLGALGGGGGGSSLAVREGGVSASETLVEAGPLKIDVTGAGVKASLTIAIPDLAIGVFSLKNMSFYAALMLPFNGDPVTLDFAFCSRENPFEIMVMGFGGGGYVMMTFDPEGMKALEISLEFGAGTSFGIGGIASGMVEIKGGLSVRYERVGDSEKLDFVVFIRIHGELDILGLISVTLTFYLELRYKTFPKQSNPSVKGDELTGTATLTIEIEIVFFSISIELSVTKTFAGDDPRFGDLMPTQTDWDSYCEAFAPATLGA